ncbi:MAG: hypothetical protein IPO00_06655, partial [Betaproteobacteria bacterium]|nr:hypothetical protein [Betaproteobacteria bacterium]
ISPPSRRSLPIRSANPIASQMCVMRSNLFGGLVANLGIGNLKRKHELALLLGKATPLQ